MVKNKNMSATTTSRYSVPTGLNELVGYLENLTKRADVNQLSRLLSDTSPSLADLRPFVEFGDRTYRRNLIHQSRWFELLCICWRSGQRSPIHDHAQSTCGLKIITGVATETIFATTECGQIKAVSSTDYRTGHVCSSQDADIHQVSNLQLSGKDLVTLHVYSPPITCMDTYSLLDSTRSIYVPHNDNVICEIGDCI